MNRLFRFADLKERGVVNSWPQLKRLQELHGFPLGKMLSPNVRAWTEDEIDEWINSRPRENTAPLKGAPRIRRERHLAARVSDGAKPDRQAGTEAEITRGSTSGSTETTGLGGFEGVRGKRLP